MRLIFVYFLPLWLLALGLIALLVTGPPVLRRKALEPGQAKLKSLRAISPVLNTLVMISVVGKPFLEHLRKNDWDTNFVAPQIATPLVVIFIVSLYALLFAVLLFFFRAIRNINAITGFRLRSPYAVLFMLVPIANLIVIPYLEYFAYQRSRALAGLAGASKPRAAFLVGLAFALLVASVALGLPSDNPSQPGTYDALALLVLSLCTGGASGILTTRIVNGIFAAQDRLARRAMGVEADRSANEERGHWLDALKLHAVAVLLVVAFATALFPGLPARIAQELLPS